PVLHSYSGPGESPPAFVALLCAAPMKTLLDWPRVLLPKPKEGADLIVESCWLPKGAHRSRDLICNVCNDRVGPSDSMCGYATSLHTAAVSRRPARLSPRGMPSLLRALLLSTLACAAASDSPDGLPQSPSIADAMKDPAVVEQAMKMMQNPMVMQQMRVMMQDPRVKERMQRMLERLGADVFAYCQDPAVLEKVAALAKNETFQAKVQQLAQNEQFTAAAGQYAAEMKDEVIADHKLAQDLGLDEFQSDMDLDDHSDDLDD
ncbi:MAG: hypothetical protein SGPRY_012382, partial [Prymnesium sp.]